MENSIDNCTNARSESDRGKTFGVALSDAPAGFVCGTPTPEIRQRSNAK
ncbi:MAG: hypothetical protein ACLQVD_05215 [Capsulimonadaceae bacterium]